MSATTSDRLGCVCLVVDDSRVVRKVARRILEGQGYTVQEAANGHEALMACRAELPQCILLDWHMPVMNGLTFLETLRSEFGSTGPAVIFCTAESNLSNNVCAVESGAQGHLAKPFDSDSLLDKLSQLGLL